MTAQIIRFQAPGAEPFEGVTAEHQAFCLARQMMNRRFLEWLRAGGDLALVRQEIEPVSAVLKQLIELERG